MGNLNGGLCTEAERLLVAPLGVASNISFQVVSDTVIRDVNQRPEGDGKFWMLRLVMILEFVGA